MVNNSNFANIFDEILNIGLFIYDIPDGWKYLNRAMCSLFNSDKLYTSHFQDLFASMPDYHDFMISLERQGKFNNRLLLKQYDGTNFWAIVSCKLEIKENSKICFGSVQNIHEIVKNEILYQQKVNLLEKTTQELDRFIYSASHDMRAPISSALGIINLMKIDSAQNRPENKTEDYILMLEKSLQKLDNFLKQLTGYAKNARKPIEDSKIDYKELLEYVLLSLKDQTSGLKIEIEINDNHEFYSDPYRLYLILYHVIKNSIDFKDLSKTIKIVNIIIQVQAEETLIEITDNGIGIPSPHIPKVFDMFYRASAQSKGSGLGLFIVREAVWKLSGSITVSSSYGIGTTIRIIVPNSIKGKLINKKKILKKRPQT